MEVRIHVILLWCCVARCVVSQTCPSNVPEDQRRDCYMWAGGNQAICESRDCVWCESQTGGVPWCFIDEEVCPSTVPELSRVDCHPEPGSSRETCTTRGCVWCPSSTGGVPWCFSDPDLSHGGKVCPAMPDEDRVDCFPVDGVSEDICINKGCYWCASALPDTPYCFTSPNIGYKMVAPPVPTTKGYQVELQRVNFPSWFGESIDSVMVDVEFQENGRLRVKIYDPSVSRYEVPVNIPSPAVAAPSPLYDIQFTDTPAFSFRVIRISTGDVIYDSSLGGFQFEDQFLQIAGRLPTTNVYGFGETEHHTLRHDMNWKKWGMWARDEPVAQANIYGVHPFMTGLDNNNQGYGILILNSNAQEVELTPAPGLVYRTTGGILDMYFFLGPTPENVIEQYTAAVGRPAMPPYWMLGFQLSRYGYNTLQNMSGVVDRMRQYDIPHDVQHGDIDTFERKLSFTYDQVNFAGLPQYIQQLKAEGTRYITILDPFISTGETGYGPFDRGQAADIWLKEADGVTPAISTVLWNSTCLEYHLLVQIFVDILETPLQRSVNAGCSLVLSTLSPAATMDTDGAFPEEVSTHDISFQLLWGSGLLITPVVTESATAVTGYIPDARWYSYYNGVEEPTRAGFTILPAPVEIIPLHFRGGHVFPTQQPGNSTMFTRSLPMGLIVALDDVNAAAGSLFWDEGDTPDTYENGEYFFAIYEVSAGGLTGTMVTDGYPGVSGLVFESVHVYGQTTAVTSITVDGGAWLSFSYDPATNVLDIFGLTVAVRSDFTVQWS